MEERCKIQIDIYSQLIHYQYPVIFFNLLTAIICRSNFNKIYFRAYKPFQVCLSNLVFFLIVTRNIFFGVFKVIFQICALLKVSIKRIKTLNGFYGFLDAFISEFAVIPPS